MSKVLLGREPDEYRGSLDCIGIRTPHSLTLVKNNDGVGDVYEVLGENREKLGNLLRYFGNNGKGKLAAEKFQPESGVEVEWEPEEQD